MERDKSFSRTQALLGLGRRAPRSSAFAYTRKVARRHRLTAAVAASALIAPLVVAVAATTVSASTTQTTSKSDVTAPAVKPGVQVQASGSANEVSPTSLKFALQQPYTNSPAQRVTFTNKSGSTLNVSVTQENLQGFAISGCAGVEVPTGKSCTADLVFQAQVGYPTASGILFFGNYPTVFAQVPITFGVLPLAFTPDTPVDLGSVPSGGTSADATVNLRNYWPVSTSITSVHTLPGSGFSVSGNTCPTPLPSGSYCAVTVRYKPGTHVGPAEDKLTFAGPWGEPGKEVLALKAVGVAGPILSASPSSLSFPTPQQSGTSSAPQTITVTNVGTAPMQLSAFFSGGSQSQYVVTDCNGTLTPPGKACPVTVIFRATGNAVTPRDSGLQLVDQRFGGSRISVPVTTGLLLPLGFDPASLDFPPTPVGGISAPMTISVRNYNTAAITVTGYRMSNNADFEVQEFTCTGKLEGGAYCQIVIRSQPSKTGPLSGDMVISGPFYGPVATETIHITGTGTAGRGKPKSK